MEGMERSLCDLLHERLDVAHRNGRTGPGRPENTSAIYAWALREAPGMLDQLLQVHLAAARERGEVPPSVTEPPAQDGDRKRMLSAIRASVARTRQKFRR